MSEAETSPAGELLAPTPELALFVAGLLLTLVVIGIVAALVVVIVREERAAAREASADAVEDEE